MSFEEIRQHIISCELALESAYADATKTSLSDDQIQKVHRLLELTEQYKKTAQQKNFIIPPEIPFTQQNILDQLDHCDKQLHAMLPKFRSPRLG